MMQADLMTLVNYDVNTNLQGQSLRVLDLGLWKDIMNPVVILCRCDPRHYGFHLPLITTAILSIITNTFTLIESRLIKVTIPTNVIFPSIL